MSDDVIEQAQQLLAPKIGYIRQLKTAREVEARLKQRVNELRADRSYATSEPVQTALDAAISSTQQALDAAKEATKKSRNDALAEGGWTRRDLSQLGLVDTRKRRKTQDTSADDADGQNDHKSTLQADVSTGSGADNDDMG